MASAGGGVGGRFLFRPGGGVGGRFALRPGGGVGGRFVLRPGGGVGGRAAGAEAMLSSSSKSNSICLYVSRYSAMRHRAYEQLVSHTAASLSSFASGPASGALHRRWMTAVMICRLGLSSVLTRVECLVGRRPEPACC